MDLIDGGLFKTVALELLPPPHDEVGAIHLAKALGAVIAKKSKELKKEELGGVARDTVKDGVRKASSMFGRAGSIGRALTRKASRAPTEVQITAPSRGTSVVSLPDTPTSTSNV